MTTHITKTWFDGEKVVTQEIPESEVYTTQKPEANQVPLVELLAAVPADIRVGVNDGNDWKAGTTWHPVGLLCHEAAAELRRQHAEIERMTKLCYDYFGELTALRAAKQMQQRIDELKEKNGGHSAP